MTKMKWPTKNRPLLPHRIPSVPFFSSLPPFPRTPPYTPPLSLKVGLLYFSLVSGKRGKLPGFWCILA